MSLVYYKFLFATTIKKRPVWITWLLYAFTITMFIIVLPAAARMNPYQVWANTTMTVCETFLGMAVALFTAVLAINVFKDSNEEGTELIIISKPISRQKIVWTKFLIFFTFCLLLNLTAVFVAVLTIFIPGSDQQFYWGLIVSMFIGNVVSFGVFGSIAILLTVNFAKVGVIITNIIISLVFLIYQILTLFVFKTPLKAITDDSVLPTTYTVMDRNIDSTDPEYGSYVERNMVDFESSPLDASGQVYAIKGKHWQDVVDYWEGTIKSQDPSKILNITDLAGQVSLSYLSVGINNYSERQARRMFALSRFWNYELTSPASPEIIEPKDHGTVKKENWHTLPIIYYGQQEYNLEPYEIPADIVLPLNYGFTGMQGTKGASLAGTYGDKLGIGFAKKDELFTRRDIYLEKDKWQKYAHGFDLIYQTIYNFDLQKVDGGNWYETNEIEDQYDINTTWTTHSNLKKYYDLLWACLRGNGELSKLIQHENVEDIEYEADHNFDIKTIEDLDERFIQYKFYTFYNVLKDQQKLLNGERIVPEAETAARADAVSSISPLILLGLNIQPMTPDGDWWLKSYDDEEGLFNLIEPGTRTINLWLMNETRKKMDDNGVTDLEIISQTTLAQYRKLSSIFESSVNPKEVYMYTNLDTPNRTTEYYGDVYTTHNSWYPYILSDMTDEGLPYGLNMELFFYEAKKTVDFWVYAVIWIAISIGLFTSGVVVYNKYDIK